MYYPNFFKRLLRSLVIGGQSIYYIFQGKISKNDLFEQLMEAGPGSLIIVLITKCIEKLGQVKLLKK